MDVRLGPMAPTLTEQGFHDPDGLLQQDAEAIRRLYIRGLLPRGEMVKAEQRLVKNLKPAEERDQ